MIFFNVILGMICIYAMLLTTLGPYRLSRLTAFLNWREDPYNTGYIYAVTHNILKEAGWFRNGLYSNVSQKLPEAHTDFAFHNFVYSLGWVSGIILCCILLVFIWRISTNAFKTKDQYGRLLVIGGAAFLAVPIFWNILMSLGFLPIIGISLPFISYGGTQLLMDCAILGIILNVYRRKDIVEPTMDY